MVGEVPESTLTVAVEVTDPPAEGVTGLGENETWMPLGRADVLKVTGELNEPIEVMVTVFGPELPPAIVIEGELNPNEKSEEVAIVNENDVVWVPEEPVPLRFIV
jgi:hypothetical protein